MKSGTEFSLIGANRLFSVFGFIALVWFQSIIQSFGIDLGTS